MRIFRKAAVSGVICGACSGVARIYPSSITLSRLARGEELDARHRPHPLIGNWRPFWDCHIEPDWLLIYRVQEAFVELYRTGSHADLFE